jgi:hypothetical protein
MNAVTGDDVKRVMKQYLSPTTCVVITTVPKQEAAPAPGGAP